jgi:hypothetical protein
MKIITDPTHLSYRINGKITDGPVFTTRTGEQGTAQWFSAEVHAVDRCWEVLSLTVSGPILGRTAPVPHRYVLGSTSDIPDWVGLLARAITSQEPVEPIPALEKEVLEFHIGRSWSGSDLEDSCPCPKEPCGLVSRLRVVQECKQHPFKAAKSIRQSHSAEDCAAIVEARKPVYSYSVSEWEGHGWVLDVFGPDEKKLGTTQVLTGDDPDAMVKDYINCLLDLPLDGFQVRVRQGA